MHALAVWIGATLAGELAGDWSAAAGVRAIGQRLTSSRTTEPAQEGEMYTRLANDGLRDEHRIVSGYACMRGCIEGTSGLSSEP